ncbi:MAG: hypothetical protein IJJ26_13080 [Victivallales bacterium]|nr:hypothetical protein [Victivallales bacterium]
MDTQKDIQEYLEKIRKTIRDSEHMVEQAELRIAETDRFLETQGMTREQLMNFRLNTEQKRLVNQELKKRGLPPVEDDEDLAPISEEAPAEPEASKPREGEVSDVDRELENRRRKFGMMMRDTRID